MRPKHQRFVDEYARDGNATAAYQRAGYRARGHAAEVNASRLRRRPDVAEAIAAAIVAANASWLRAEERRAGRAITLVRIRGLGTFNVTTGHFEKTAGRATE